MRKTSIASLTLLAAVPVLALAWSPYDPYPMPPPYQGIPGSYGQPYPMPPAPFGPGYPEGRPAAPSAPAQSDAAAPGQPGVSERPWLGAPGWGSSGRPLGGRPAFPRLDVARGVDGDDYLIDIEIQNIEPDQVQVRPAGRGLVIAYDRSAQTSREDNLPGGEGYRRSYSISRGTTTRRVGLPSDAKVAEMSREVKDGHILLRIPRGTGLPEGYR